MIPHNLLPTPEPRDASPPLGQFYNTVAKHLIPDVVRIMNNGIPIDMAKVSKLEATVDTVLSNVHRTLAKNKYIQKYMASRRDTIKTTVVEEFRTKMKSPKDFIKPFKHNDIIHRSFYIKNVIGIIPTGAEVLPGIPKWTVADIKAYCSINTCSFDDLLKGTPNPSIVESTIQDMASYRASLYNRQYETKIKHINTFIPPEPFNPGSTTQKHQLLTDMLGLESDKYTDAWITYEKECKKLSRRGLNPEEHIKPPANKYSWNRNNIENQLAITDDPILQELLQCLIDFSFSSIIKTNFIQAFHTYTIDGRLYGNLRLGGAKSFRLTSSNPNLLNLPSTGSIYAKPVKKCFIAPPGWVVATADYAALIIYVS